MNFSNAEELVNKLKAKPVKTIIELVVLLLLVAIIAYLSAYYSEKGKRHAIVPSTNTETPVAPTQMTPKEKVNSSGITINQSTQGDQSPAVVSGGSITIEYEARKDKNKKE